MCGKYFCIVSWNKNWWRMLTTSIRKTSSRIITLWYDNENLECVLARRFLFHWLRFLVCDIIFIVTAVVNVSFVIQNILSGRFSCRTSGNFVHDRTVDSGACSENVSEHETLNDKKIFYQRICEWSSLWGRTAKDNSPLLFRDGSFRKRERTVTIVIMKVKDPRDLSHNITQ